MKKKQIITWSAIGLFLVTAIVGIKLYKGSAESFDANSDSDNTLVDKVWDADWTEKELVAQGKPILIDFTASWCVPCKTFNPILEKTKRELGDEVIIKIVDVDKYPEIAKKYPLRVIPTQILITSDGKPFEPSDKLGIYGFLGYDDEKTKKEITVHEGAILDQAKLLTMIEEMVVNKEQNNVTEEPNEEPNEE